MALVGVAGLDPPAHPSMSHVAAAFGFEAFCKASGLPIPIPEHRFHPSRRWRLDYAFLAHRLAIEVDGGIWIRGKHGRGSGIVKDHEKNNAAVCLGWRILRVQPNQLYTAATLDLIRRSLNL